MQKIKKALRLALYILLIVIASFGVGLSGGVPLPKQSKREQGKDNIELVKDNKSIKTINEELT